MGFLARVSYDKAWDANAQGKTGSGILSYMSAQAGANQVIALEASSMAEKIEIVRRSLFVNTQQHDR